MNEPKPKQRKWSDDDAEAMYATVGRYVIIFQWVEGLLDQILLLGWGHENWKESQAKLAGMNNFRKIEAVKELVLTSADFERVHRRPGWVASFENLIDRLQEERNRRNSLLHSQFLFDFVKIGLPPLRSLRKRMVDGEATFDQEYFTPEAQQKLIKDLVLLGMDVNFTYVQLIHDYKAPRGFGNDDGPGIGTEPSRFVRDAVTEIDREPGN